MKLSAMLALVVAVMLARDVCAASSHDRALTPGDIETSDPDVICHPGYSRAQRVWNMQGPEAYMTLRRQVFERYRIPYSDRTRYELDDLVPLCLGGRQSLANLWPERWREAIEKDRIEREMCRQVCETHTEDAVRRAQEWFMGW